MKRECVVIDLYQYPVACGTPDPCMDGLTLWRLQPCEVDTMGDFCATYADHPACATYVPPVPHEPVPLPTAGGGGLLALAVALTLVGGAVRAGATLSQRSTSVRRHTGALPT